MINPEIHGETLIEAQGIAERYRNQCIDFTLTLAKISDDLEMILKVCDSEKHLNPLNDIKIICRNALNKL